MKQTDIFVYILDTRKKINTRISTRRLTFAPILKSWHYLRLQQDQRAGVTTEQMRKLVWRMCKYCFLSFGSANSEEY
jgi:hypothetical protein